MVRANNSGCARFNTFCFHKAVVKSRYTKFGMQSRKKCMQLQIIPRTGQYKSILPRHSNSLPPSHIFVDITMTPRTQTHTYTALLALNGPKHRTTWRRTSQIIDSRSTCLDDSCFLYLCLLYINSCSNLSHETDSCSCCLGALEYVIRLYSRDPRVAEL